MAKRARRKYEDDVDDGDPLTNLLIVVGYVSILTLVITYIATNMKY